MQDLAFIRMTCLTGLDTVAVVIIGVRSTRSHDCTLNAVWSGPVGSRAGDIQSFTTSLADLSTYESIVVDHIGSPTPLQIFERKPEQMHILKDEQERDTLTKVEYCSDDLWQMRPLSRQ